MKHLRPAVPVFLLALVASDAFAHAGHGNPAYSHSILHYVLEPVHAASWGTLLLLGVGLLVVRARRSRRKSR